jgi:hypothetical protein
MGLDPKRIEVMNAIASAMMDGAMPLLRLNPPDVAFEAVMSILFFIGEECGHTYAEVAELTLKAAKQLEEDEA